MTEADLLETLKLNELLVYFQPIYSMRTGDVIGLEALLRPIGPVGEMVSPGIVFDRADQDGVLDDLERAARELSLAAFAAQRGTVRGEDDAPLILFLNFSAALLDVDQLHPDRIRESVGRHNLPVESVALEIVEAGVTSHDDLSSFVQRNRESGFLIILDDFGTGDSNLERIARVRPDVIKIDRSIVSGAAADPTKRMVLQATTRLATTIGALSLAVGVERYEDLLVCAEESVDLVQGFLLSRPVPTIAAACRRDRPGVIEALDRADADLRSRVLSTNEREVSVASAVDALVESLSGKDEEELEGILAAALGSSHEMECAWILDGAGIQRSRMILAPDRRGERLGGLTRPLPKGSLHRLREYFYRPQTLGRERDISRHYLSMVYGRICRTWFQEFSGGDGEKRCLCVDIPEISPSPAG
jgi:EAL domain-containing protein (putative c-di-GMP-specific phosphodiesterase class I)